MAPMMSYAGEVSVQLAADAAVQVVDLPYGGGAYSMTIVMPNDAAGIDALVAGLTANQWNGWMGALDSTRIAVTMPKFRLVSDLTLNDVLTALGMQVAFCGPWVTDFSRMIRSVAACISNVKHKNFVDVTEEGTEAAAATSVETVRPEVAVTTCPARGSSMERPPTA